MGVPDRCFTAAGDTDPTKEPPMDENDVELIEESLVEDVSIDGMCGVY